MSEFMVAVRSFLCSLEDWGKVLRTPEDQLPKLTPEQRASLKRWGTSEEDERRSALYQSVWEERRRAYEAQGLALGKAIQDILEGVQALGPYKLWAVIIEAARDEWLVRIETPQRVLELPIAATLRDQVLRNGGPEAQEMLRREVLRAIGRDDQLGPTVEHR